MYYLFAEININADNHHCTNSIVQTHAQSCNQMPLKHKVTISNAINQKEQQRKYYQTTSKQA